MTKRQRFGQVALCQFQSGSGYYFDEKESGRLWRDEEIGKDFIFFPHFPYFRLVAKTTLQIGWSQWSKEFTTIRSFKI